MEPFLLRTARLLCTHHPGGFERVAVVLPGRRAGVHLRKYLAQAQGGALWSPELLDVGSFLERFTGLETASTMELLFVLHDLHRASAGQEADPFDVFLQWAPATLRDLSEVDAHLLDLDRFYRDLRTYEEINDWSFTRLGAASPGQRRLLRYWRETGELHHALHGAMAAAGRGTLGWVARCAAGRAGELVQHMPWDHVWFVGLNALDPASMRVLQVLKDAGRARFLWDADRHYLRAGHEAGRFIRQAMATLGPGAIEPVERLPGGPERIRAHAVPNAVAQAALAAQLLAGMSAAERAGTAVVLASEHLLLPLLDALPKELGPVNVTMGLPLTALPVHGLLDAFLAVHAGRTPDGRMRTPDLERLLAHPFLQQGDATRRMRQGLSSAPDGLTTGELAALVPPGGAIDVALVRNALEAAAKVPDDLDQRLAALLSWAKRCVQGDELALEQLYRAALLHRRLFALLQRHPGRVNDAATFRSVHDRLLRGERIAFHGEPLEGLQVMGLLETRALAYDRVLVLGANEGALPPTGVPDSWIPFDVRHVNHLPLPHDADAINAYHVQRLVQHAGHVDLIHATAGTDVQEPSRYIAQWDQEREQRVEHLAWRPPHPVRQARPVQVAKEGAVLELLRERAAKGFTPTMLGTWLRCPMDFYHRHLLGIPDPRREEDPPGPDLIGMAVHRAAERIYRPWLGVPIAPDMLREAASLAADLVQAELAAECAPSLVRTGSFRLKADMAARALRSHLLAEARRCEREETVPLAVERNLYAEVRPGLVFGGRSDRIERRGGVVHVLDLKTGGADEKRRTLGGLSREHLGAGKDHALQLLVYAWAFLMVEPDERTVRAALVPLRQHTRHGALLRIGDSPDITRQMLPAITDLLDALAAGIMDPAVPFEHHPASEHCLCCAE